MAGLSAAATLLARGPGFATEAIVPTMINAAGNAILAVSDILISSYQTGGSSGGSEVPMDQISFNFAKLEMGYKEQKADGTLGGEVKAGWDVKANKKV